MCKFVVEHMKYNVMFDEYDKVYTTIEATKPRLHY